MSNSTVLLPVCKLRSELNDVNIFLQQRHNEKMLLKFFSTVFECDRVSQAITKVVGGNTMDNESPGFEKVYNLIPMLKIVM